MALEQSNEGFSIPVCEEEPFERTHREDPCNQRAQALISADPGQSLRKLASIVDVNEPTMRRIAEENFRYKLYTLKIDTTDAL